MYAHSNRICQTESSTYKKRKARAPFDPLMKLLLMCFASTMMQDLNLIFKSFGPF
jgi:hypothetical protein